jgi:aldehyde oxidoreductase
MVAPRPAPNTNTVALKVNGRTREVRADHEHLLVALREELGLTDLKDGCSPSGHCGACAVVIDGQARLGCKTPVRWAAGRTVTTPEGLDTGTRRRFAEAFAAHGAAQCGFCIPGIVMRAAPLVAQDRPLSRDEIARRLEGHLCRCTGYTKIIDAIQSLADDRPAPQSGRGIGARRPRYRAAELALGGHPYIDDMTVPGLAHAALRLTEHARADIVRIDTSAARGVSGVLAVLTGSDVPGDPRVGLIGADWPVLVPEGGRTSYLGDVLAIVVAGDRATARRAAQLVAVEYRPLAPIVDPDQALADPEPAVWGVADNVLHRAGFRRGDVSAALATATHVVTDVFQTQRVEHAFLEPESTLAVPTDGGVKVWSAGQGIWDDRRQIASVLGLPPERVEVVSVSSGGAFGGKEDMANQAQTALAAWVTGRAVKCTLSREESLLIHPKRHPFRMRFEAGCDKDGRLVALRADLLADSGAYGSVGLAVLEWTVGHVTGPYVVPNVEVSGVAVRTNNPVCGAFRGFGAVQAQFAVEGIMDRLADATGLDRWEIRRRNLVRPGTVWGPGQTMGADSRAAARCLDAVKPHYDRARHQGKAVGIGMVVKNSGLGDGYLVRSIASVTPLADGRVEVRHGFSEMGQGVNTVAIQVAAEELGIDEDSVVVVVDTHRDLPAGQTTGSRTALAVAAAVGAACRTAIEGGRRAGVEYRGIYEIDSGLPPDTDEPVGTVLGRSFCYAAQLVVMDRDTGRIEHVTAIHDVGRAINPMLCEGQVEGGVHMGLGYALSEDFPADDEGRPTRRTLNQLGILTPRQMPPVDVVLLEEAAPDTPYGIKGIGEMGLIATPAAVAGALRDLDGVWRRRLPLRPEPEPGRTPT